MQIALPEPSVVATIVLDPGTPPTEAQFLAFCEANRDLKIERTAEGEIVILPPAGGESDDRNMDVTTQLRVWWREKRSGRPFGPTALFLLPDGSALSPDASWVSNERIATLTREQRRGFLPICPEFIVEVMSPSDRLRTAQKKMHAWIANGVELAWLIDGDAMRVYVYRQSGEVQIVTGDTIHGEGPVAGFTMSLADIWQGF